jgi:hypothetical protein
MVLRAWLLFRERELELHVLDVIESVLGYVFLLGKGLINSNYF